MIKTEFRPHPAEALKFGDLHHLQRQKETRVKGEVLSIEGVQTEIEIRSLKRCREPLNEDG